MPCLARLCLEACCAVGLHRECLMGLLLVLQKVLFVEEVPSLQVFRSVVSLLVVFFLSLLAEEDRCLTCADFECKEAEKKT